MLLAGARGMDVGDTSCGVLSGVDRGADGGVVRIGPGRLEDEDAEEDELMLSLGAVTAE